VSRRDTVGVLLLAAAVGLLLSLYGPAIPELRTAYGLGGGGAALVLSAHFAGAMTGIGWWGLERRLAPRTWLLVATVLLAAGAVGVALAPAWPVVLAAAFGLGVGFGVVVVEINVLFAEGFGERAAAMLNLLGASFGAGAVLGPLAIAATGGYRVPFCAGALMAVASLVLARDLPRTPRTPVPREDQPALGLVGGFVALCALYVAGRAGPGPHPRARPDRLHPDRPRPWAGVPDRARLAGPGGARGARLDGHGVRRRPARRGVRAGGDRPAGRRELAGGDPDQRAGGGAGLPGRDPAAAPLGRRALL
jgi:MFS family permease